MNAIILENPRLNAANALISILELKDTHIQNDPDIQQMTVLSASSFGKSSNA